MSSAVVSTSAALGRPFLFDAKAVPELSLPSQPSQGHPRARPPQRIHPTDFSVNLASSDPRLAHITSASRLDIRPAPEMVSSGIPAIDALTGGMPRGCLTEICGPASSGRTTLLLAALAAATRRGEFCAVVDASDALDPHSAAAAGVDLNCLLWVRCGDASPKNFTQPRKTGAPKEFLARREKLVLSFESAGSQAAFDFRPIGFAAIRAPTGASAARHRSAARKRRLRPDRPRSRRPSTKSSAADSLDHMVPLPPRHRTYVHDPAGSRATSHRRKLLLPAAASWELRSGERIARRKPWDSLPSPGGTKER